MDSAIKVGLRTPLCSILLISDIMKNMRITNTVNFFYSKPSYRFVFSVKTNKCPIAKLWFVWKCSYIINLQNLVTVNLFWTSQCHYVFVIPIIFVKLSLQYIETSSLFFPIIIIVFFLSSLSQALFSL